jgi:hypothetical protein
MRRRARDCGDKKPYSELEARRAAASLTAQSGARFHAYKCPFCYLTSGACAWHVGHAQRLARRLG